MIKVGGGICSNLDCKKLGQTQKTIIFQRSEDYQYFGLCEDCLKKALKLLEGSNDER